MTFLTDQASIQPTWLSRWDPRWKIAAFGLTTFLVTLLRSETALAAAAVAVIALTVSVRPDGRWLGRRSASLAFFLAPFMVYLLFGSISSGPWQALRLALRAILVFQLAAIVVASTPMHRAARALSSLGVPRLVTKLLVMTHRYTVVLRDQWQRIGTALHTRGFQVRASRRSWQTMGMASAVLLLSAEDRAKRVAAAMRCRGFDGQFHDYHRPSTRASDVARFVVMVSVVGAITAFDRIAQ